MYNQSDLICLIQNLHFYKHSSPLLQQLYQVFHKRCII